MSPVAITNDRSRESNSPRPLPLPLPLPHDALNIARHPSPWHEIAHTLSATPTTVSSRRGSSPTPYTNSLPITNSNMTKPEPTISSPLHSALSSSQALRDWEARLASPDSDVRRHQLVHPPNTNALVPVRGSPVLPPKLAAERDKEGHIEYKLKLIDPSQERFGKLVTQMMWRLKQGKNEAIYEIGLADDGTVVGLTRAEMDASLKTLEAMASELGATVMILREIVLSGAPPSTRDGSPVISDTSSSFLSTSSAHSDNESVWPVKRPDLDEYGRPKKGTRALSNNDDKSMIVKRVHKDIAPQYKARQVIFDLAERDVTGGNDVLISSPPTAQARKETAEFDDDIPPFELDLDDSIPPPERRRKKVVSEQMQIDPKKFDAKRAKLAKRREERRMDLLRGDGMSPTWLDTQPIPVPPPGLTSQLLAKIPHQPARPSSLRLASPAPSTSTIRPTAADDDGSLWGLSETPLDSLSLSFADVQIQDISPSTSSTTDQAVGLGLEWHASTTATVRPITGKEMVCVEALVVRKVQHGHGADGEDGSEEEECGWGGQDDVWGLGVDSD